MKIVHIEESSSLHNSDDKFVHTMLCGEQCIIWENGNIEPKGFDFCLFKDAHLANCMNCRDKHITKRFHKIVEKL